MKTRYFIIAAAFLLIGCSRTEINETFNDGSLTAFIDCSAGATKSILVDNPGIRMESRWQAGESIGIFGDGGANVKFSISGADISEDGKTARFSSSSGVPSGDLTAVSPYQLGSTASSGVVTIDFPATQNYLTNDGMPMPDPASTIMLGRGSAAGGLIFRNATAILKIGQTFDEPTIVKSVEFKDLSGKAVSGAMSLSFEGGFPKAEIIGSGSVITLDCGDGVSLEAEQTSVFFLVVPARTYPNGFEITFVDADGAKTVKTAGTLQGKTLERSIVYTVGDISAREYVEGTQSNLKPTAILMTAENMEKVTITERYSAYVYDKNGKPLETVDGYLIRMPEYTMTVHKDLNPVKGGWMIFEQGSDELPGGGVYRITFCTKKNEDYFDVVAKPEANPVEAFDKIVVGEEMVDGSGEIDEENGVPLDISDYVKSIVDESGNERYFSTDASGRITLSEAELQSMVDVATKANKAHSHTFHSPQLSGNLKSDNAELAIGASMAFNTRLALGVMQGELQYVYLTVNPQITVSESLTIKSEVSLDKKFRLFTITTHPIPISPALAVVVEIVFNASLGISGNLQITATGKCTADLGTYSVSYNSGDGVIFRCKNQLEYVPGSFDMDLSGVEGSISCNASIGARTSMTLWGLCGVGVYSDYTLKCGFFTSNGNKYWKKFALQPEVEFTPVLSSYFYTHKFEDMTAKIDLDPIWEKYVIPESSSSVASNYIFSEKYYDINLDEDHTIQLRMPIGISGINYKIGLEGECYKDLDVVLLVYTGSGIQYTPADPSVGQDELDKFRAIGYEHLFRFAYMCDKKLVGISEKPDQILEIGTYKADSGSETFEGTATGSFRSGTAYGVVPAIRTGDSYYIINSGGSSNYYNPFYFYDLPD